MLLYAHYIVLACHLIPLSDLHTTVPTKYMRPKGQIIAQSVTEGTTFTPKHLSSIQLTVSKGKRPIKKETSKTTASPTKKPKENSDYDVKENDDYISIPLE